MLVETKKAFGHGPQRPDHAGQARPLGHVAAGDIVGEHPELELRDHDEAVEHQEGRDAEHQEGTGPDRLPQTPQEFHRALAEGGAVHLRVPLTACLEHALAQEDRGEHAQSDGGHADRQRQESGPVHLVPEPRRVGHDHEEPGSDDEHGVRHEVLHAHQAGALVTAPPGSCRRCGRDRRCRRRPRSGHPRSGSAPGAPGWRVPRSRRAARPRLPSRP